MDPTSSLRVRAVVGSRTILLAVSADSSDAFTHCVGLAIKRETLRTDDGPAMHPPAESSDNDQPTGAPLATPSFVWLNHSSSPKEPPSSDHSPAGVLTESLTHLQLSEGNPPYDPCNHPIQLLRWADYTVTPGETYRYTVHKVLQASSDSQRSLADPVAVCVTSERECGADGCGIVFNRGAAGSQAYTRRFGAATPRGPRRKDEPAPWEWLSRGLEEGILAFIRRATGPEWGIRAAFYELSYYPVLRALAEARAAGADVRLVYDSKPPTWHAGKREWSEHGPSILNDAAVTQAGLRHVAVKRTAGLSAIQHNKFMVLLRNGTPVAVWTGSTNITTSGIFGHLNVAHEHSLPDLTYGYLRYWEQLAKDPTVKQLAAFNETDSPVPSLTDHGSFVIFSPRQSEEALQYYSDLIRTASQAVFLTAAFGVSSVIAEGLLRAPSGSFSSLGASQREPLPLPPVHDTPTYLLLDNPGRGMSPRFVEAVRALPHGHVVCGARLEEAGMTGPEQLAETLTELNKHVEYVHTKFLLVDPLGDDPAVVSGSANFSKASTTSNDENMVVLRGEDAKRAARVFLVEFMRLHKHFGSREAANAKAMSSPSKVAQLKQVSTAGDGGGGHRKGSGAWWWRPYFRDGSKQHRERLLFAE